METNAFHARLAELRNQHRATARRDHMLAGGASALDWEEALPDYVRLALGAPVDDPHPLADQLYRDGDGLRHALMRITGASDAASFERLYTYSQLPDLVVNAVVMAIAQAPDAVTEHRLVCRQVALPNYKAATFGTIHLDDSIPAAPDGPTPATVPLAELSNWVTTGRPVRYLLGLRVGRQLLVSADLDLMGLMLGEARLALLKAEARAFASYVESNPTLGDGSALFVSGTNYVASGGGAPSLTTLDLAVKALRTMPTGAGSGIGGARGRLLLVPPALETTSRVLLATIDPRGEAGFELVVNPFLSSDTGWYLLAPPAENPSILRLTLGASDEPRSESFPLRDGDGLGVRFEHAAGFVAQSRLGIYKNAGI